MMAAPQFTLTNVQTPFGPASQVSCFIPEGVTTPDDFIAAWKALDLKIPPGNGVILEGRAPIWGYLIMAHACHATSWMGQFDPRLGVVVVQTHVEGVAEGAVFPLPT